jgi:hypothetical protein
LLARSPEALFAALDAAPEDMNDEHVREFETQGFIVRRGLVPPDEVAMLRAEMER